MNSDFRPISGRLWVVQLCEVVSRRIEQSVKDWPTKQKEGLGDQLIRATDSIGANISEGYARVHIKERVLFFSWAQGSVEEALYHLRRARDRQLIGILDASIISELFFKLSKGIAKLAAAQNVGIKGGEP